MSVRIPASSSPRFALLAMALAVLFLGARAGRAQMMLAADAPAAMGGSAAEEDDFYDDEYTMTKVSDPLIGYNRFMFRVNESFLNHVGRPVARGYQKVLPTKARKGIGNFFDNLRYPVRLVGCLLQGRVQRGGLETGKFLVNSTVGLAGFIRVSDRVPELRDVPAEDIGQSLGRWGFKPGPYIVLPLMGPSNLRDLIGTVGDSTLTPTNWHFVRQQSWTIRGTVIATNTIQTLPDMIELYDGTIGSAVDPYIAMRNGFLQYREAAVKK